jgi:hypothetical protein
MSSITNVPILNPSPLQLFYSLVSLLQAAHPSVVPLPRTCMPQVRPPIPKCFAVVASTNCYDSSMASIVASRDPSTVTESESMGPVTT